MSLESKLFELFFYLFIDRQAGGRAPLGRGVCNLALTIEVKNTFADKCSKQIFLSVTFGDFFFLLLNPKKRALLLGAATQLKL